MRSGAQGLRLAPLCDPKRPNVRTRASGRTGSPVGAACVEVANASTTPRLRQHSWSSWRSNPTSPSSPGTFGSSSWTPVTNKGITLGTLPRLWGRQACVKGRGHLVVEIDPPSRVNIRICSMLLNFSCSEAPEAAASRQAQLDVAPAPPPP